MRAHLAVALLAAATTAVVTGLLPSGQATADHYTGRDGQVEVENKQLRSELAYYQSAYDEMVLGLDRIDRAADKLRDRAGRKRIQTLVDTTRDRADQYVDGIERDGWGHDYTAYDYALSDTELARVISRVQAESYSDEQLALIRSVARTSYFTADQVVSLMKLCAYDDTRVEVAAALYPRVVDGQNWYLVYDGLTYSSSKKTLRERIGE